MIYNSIQIFHPLKLTHPASNAVVKKLLYYEPRNAPDRCDDISASIKIATVYNSGQCWLDTGYPRVREVKELCRSRCAVPVKLYLRFYENTSAHSNIFPWTKNPGESVPSRPEAFLEHTLLSIYFTVLWSTFCWTFRKVFCESLLFGANFLAHFRSFSVNGNCI